MASKPNLLVFFILAIAISWTAWIPYAAAQAGLIKIRVPAECIWLAEYGPSLAAILIVIWASGWPGVKKLLGKLLHWKVGIGWYSLAVLVTPAIVVATLGIDYLWSGSLPDVKLLEGWHARFIERTRAFSPSAGLISSLVSFMEQGPIATALVFVALAVTNGGLSEEVGWRGYALPRLQASGRSALFASVLVGLMWALWHTGTGFWQAMLTSNPGEALAFAGGYLFQYTLLVVPLAVVYTCLYNGTGGSLLLAVILHACYNMTITIVTSAWPEFPMLLFVVLLWLFAGTLVTLFGPRHLARGQAAECPHLPPAAVQTEPSAAADPAPKAGPGS